MSGGIMGLIAALTLDVQDPLETKALSLPDVKSEHVLPAVEAARRYATAAIPAELLVSIMWGESRFVPTVRKGRVCGVMQVNPSDIGRSRTQCTDWDRDVAKAVEAGVHELETMLRDHRVKGDMRKALLYRACGNAAFNGRCRKTGWPGWVLERARKLRAQ